MILIIPSFLENICPQMSGIITGFNDEDMTKSKGKDPLEGLGGPMTRARARKAKEALQQVLSILFEYKPKFQGEKSKVVSCIMAQMEED